MPRIDWSKAGKRIRWQKPRDDGTNPDWDWARSRWKDEADYYGEELIADEVIARVGCGYCVAAPGQPCRDARGRDMDGPHYERRRAAGKRMLDENGPRFTTHRRPD